MEKYSSKICMNCENPFICDGPYFTCRKCNGPCDTFRYSSNYAAVGEPYYDANFNQQKNENSFGKSGDFNDLPFRRRVPKPKPSTSKSLRKLQTSDQFRVLGYRIYNLCSRFADPFTWLEMIKDSKSKYDVKKRGGSPSEQSEDSHTEQDDESFYKP